MRGTVATHWMTVAETVFKRCTIAFCTTALSFSVTRAALCSPARRCVAICTRRFRMRSCAACNSVISVARSMYLSHGRASRV